MIFSLIAASRTVSEKLIQIQDFIYEGSQYLDSEWMPLSRWLSLGSSFGSLPFYYIFFMCFWDKKNIKEQMIKVRKDQSVV